MTAAALNPAIAARVRTAISRVLGHAPGVLAPECSLIEQLGADQLDLVEIAIELEEEFGCEVDDGEMHQAGTVGELCALIEAKTGAPANV